MSSPAERIPEAFAGARGQGRAALMPYMMAGYPDREASLEIARAYADAGADLVEVGVPFSDPLADGPVIHAAAGAALRAGAGLGTALEAVEALAPRVPAVLMCYVNMILATGAERFAERAAEAGASGVIVPDLPYGEAPEVADALRARGLAPVQLIAPTTPRERRERICRSAECFVYVVSTAGTTGERDEVPPELADLVAAVRKEAAVPAAVGFGIGTPEQAAAVGRVADGVIIGSRLVRIAADAGDTATAVRELRAFLTETREALAGAGAPA